jgi:hypothetical protein
MFLRFMAHRLKRALGVMTRRHLIYLLLSICLLSGCHKDPGGPTPPAASPTATPVTVVDAKTAFGSPEAMTKFLEQRWPLDAIRAFCIPERRHNNMYQNLVAGFNGQAVWEGTLYRGTATGFDKIAWYANTENGRATVFSLGAKRGEDFWVIEGGSEESVKTPPDYLPDPKRPWFVGHR